MKAPSAAFLDSTELSEDSTLGSAGWDSLRRAVKSGELRIGVSEVSVLELVRQAREKTDKFNESMVENARRFRALSIPLPEHQPLSSESFESDLRERLEKSSIFVAPIPPLTQPEVLARDFAVQPPFLRSGKGYRDTLIWISFIRWLDSMGLPEDSYATFVSRNSKDFGDFAALAAELPQGVRLILADKLATLVESIRPVEAEPESGSVENADQIAIAAGIDAFRSLVGFPFDDLPVEEPYIDLPEVEEGVLTVAVVDTDSAEAELVDTVDGVQIWNVAADGQMNVEGLLRDEPASYQQVAGWHLSATDREARWVQVSGRLNCTFVVDVRVDHRGQVQDSAVTKVVLKPRAYRRFELIRTARGQFHFNLRAASGEIILTSEMYQSRLAALNGIDSVKRNAAKAEVVDLA